MHDRECLQTTAQVLGRGRHKKNLWPSVVAVQWSLINLRNVVRRPAGYPEWNIRFDLSYHRPEHVRRCRSSFRKYLRLPFHWWCRQAGTTNPFCVFVVRWTKEKKAKRLHSPGTEMKKPIVVNQSLRGWSRALRFGSDCENHSRCFLVPRRRKWDTKSAYFAVKP